MKIAGLTVKNNVVTEIGKFAILWNRFEHRFCNNHCNLSKIIENGKSIIIDEIKLNNFREAVKKRMELFGVDSTTYVFHELHLDKKYMSPEDCRRYMEQFIDNTKPDNITGCLLIIYRIRNNMMHGLKDINELDGQLDLFQAANGVLEDL